MPRGHYQRQKRGPYKKQGLPRLCKRGHLMDYANIYVKPDGYTACKACARERLRAFRAARKEQS